MTEFTFQPFELVTRAFAIDDHESPAWALFTVTPAFVQRLQKLSRLVIEQDLHSVSALDAPDEWDQQDEMRIRCHSLQVVGDSFWFDAYPKHCSYSVETQGTSILDLIDLINAIQSGQDPVALPEGYCVRDGIYFYDASFSGSDDLADLFFDSRQSAVKSD